MQTDLQQLSTMTLTNGFRNDDLIQLGPLHSQSLFQFIQISDAYFVHLEQGHYRKSSEVTVCFWLMYLQKKLPLSVFSNSLLELKPHILFETLGSVHMIAYN